MPKKRKLNSNNPKYKPEAIRDDKVLRKFIKEVKGVKVYAIYSLQFEQNKPFNSQRYIY